ncbi:hypothetical protein BJ138DRAFT_509113 [Hygrophoropsis aurantiaca]|uniref:Uncharacterized protein n=1 Tax=Hygrophoropsis aurantiaca TaxID=72124 RepID=A0ACB8A2B4_9AGAM|nr:hypothetical protein BJ138DRAFT_509113 [Hygrophoropsis aurantiaca]
MVYSTQDQDNVNAAIARTQDEAQELENQEHDLTARLRLTQNSLALKRTAIARLKNSITPVYRLPNEMLLSCFHLTIELWKNEIERSNENSILYDEEIRHSPCTPAVAISHVSHFWRQLTINAPFFWTYLNPMPLKEEHMDVHGDMLHRIGNMPFALDFWYRGNPLVNKRPVAVTAATTTPITSHANQKYGIFSVNASEVAVLLSRSMGFSIMNSSRPNSFNHLTTLSVLHVDVSPREGLDYYFWKRFLSNAPRLRNLQISSNAISNYYPVTTLTNIKLPKLEDLTTVGWNPGLENFFVSLSVPDLRQLRLLDWDLSDGLSTLFVDSFPRFPKVRNLTLKLPLKYRRSFSYQNRRDFINAFPNITHFRGHPALFKLTWNHRPFSSWPDLQQFTLDFVRYDVHSRDFSDLYRFLEARATQAKYPLRIRIAERDRDTYSYYHLTNLAQYGEVLGALCTCDTWMKAQSTEGLSLIERRRFYQSVAGP